MEKSQTIEGLKAMKFMFDDFNVPFVLTEGLVLGYARYKDIMDWDVTDLDMGVFVPVSDEIKDIFDTMLKERKIRIPLVGTFIEKVPFHVGYKDFKIHDALRIDNKFWEHKGEYFETLSYNGRYILREHERWFSNPQPVEFLGTTFLIPDKIEDYLDNHYGKGWETNIIKGIPKWLAEYRQHPEKYPYPMRTRQKNGRV